jgi:3-deoxy-7-phosphoheptulonate synthase
LIIKLHKNFTAENLHQIKAVLTLNQFEYTFVEPESCLVVPKLKSPNFLIGIDGIDGIVEIDTTFQLASKKYKQSTVFEVNGIEIGGHQTNVIAGPCSVEDEKQIFETAAFLNRNGLKFMRGGAYKPRTSPYAFRGLGLDGLKMMSQAAKENGLNVVTELMDLSLLDHVLAYTDIIQIGSRNMSNFYMLAELGKINKPILLKRGMSARINEWLLAADYILSGGNQQVILCERGLRSFDTDVRNQMDITAIPMIQSMSHLPVFADPSHGTGSAKFVKHLSLASIAAGVNGLMIEIHPNPSNALSDADQALTFSEFEQLLNEMRGLAKYFNRPIDSSISLYK